MEEFDRTREIPSEILRDILLRLPAKDVLRSSCVSKLWCGIVGDASFRKLHATAAPSESSSEALLISINREPGRRDEASVFHVASGKAMCHAAIPGGYSLTGICNGFLCFALQDDYEQAPAVVCNPVTGETLRLPKAPLRWQRAAAEQLSHRFVLGFSPPTNEYKMFRLSSPSNEYYSSPRPQAQTTYIAAYTLGDTAGGGWREYSHTSQFRPLRGLPPPVHIDGDLYVTVETGRPLVGSERSARMLVLNVATEKCSTHRLPYDFHSYHLAHDMYADSFDLGGQMCLAVNIFEDDGRGDELRKIQFWVMAPPGELDGGNDDRLQWSLRYSFDLGNGPFYYVARGAWLDHNGMLCYRHGSSVWKYDTRGRRGCSSSSSSSSVRSSSRLLLFDEQLQLPESPSSSAEWNICGGYRPSLLSPLTFAVPPSSPKKQRKFEHDLLHALAQSKRKKAGQNP